MAESSDYQEMTFRSIQCYMPDGEINARELASIIDIAERDGRIDENEKAVLRRLMAVIVERPIDDDMAARLEVLAEILAD